MARLLEALGHIAVVAASGSEALRLMGLFRPHVLLLDLSMPGVDGFEVARLARLDLDGSSVRIVAVTGHGQKSDLDRTRGAGFDAHLVKPVTLRQLEEALGD
jgi:two-component system CheB/CheR fusion protein